MISIGGKGYSPCCAFENLICGSRYSIIIVIIIIVVVIVIVVVFHSSISKEAEGNQVNL